MNKFDINKYNSIKDLKNLFYPEISESNPEDQENKAEKSPSINYLDYISLSSDSDLLNSLFFINRAISTKTFIELILPNQLEFNEDNYFIKNLIEGILRKNYIFIVENNILKNATLKVKLVIKILNDTNDDIVSIKEIDLFNQTETQKANKKNNNTSELGEEQEEEEGNYLDISKIEYNFGKTDYFLMDLDTIKSLKWKDYDQIFYFLADIANECPKLKIMLILNSSSLSDNESATDLILNKRIIELSDIIFSFKEPLNNFYKSYNNLNKKKSTNFNNVNASTASLKTTMYIRSFSDFRKNNYDKISKNSGDVGTKKDLIIKDKKKFRKDIPRVCIILDNFDFATIYSQTEKGFPVPEYNENFYFSLLDRNHTLNEFKENDKFILSNKEKCFYIFIGGFLSRLINNKELNESFKAGNIVLKSNLILLKNNIDYITNVDDYNITIPVEKKTNQEILIEKIKKEQKLNLKKEQNFVLDCLNPIKCQKKEYNSLLDSNCTSFFLKKINFNHLAEKGFINENGIILNDPDSSKITGLANINEKNRKFGNLIVENKFFYDLNNKNKINTIIKERCQSLGGIKMRRNRKNNNGILKYYQTQAKTRNDNHSNFNSTSTSLSNNRVNTISNYNRTQREQFDKNSNNNDQKIYQTTQNYALPKMTKTSQQFFARDMIQSKKDRTPFLGGSEEELFKKLCLTGNNYYKTSNNSVNKKRRICLEKNYNKYLYSLYQPKKKYKTFLNSYEYNVKNNKK